MKHVRDYSTYKEFLEACTQGDARIDLPYFPSNEVAARWAIDVQEFHAKLGVFVIFRNGGPMHPAPPHINKAVLDVTGVYVIPLTGCESSNREGIFTAAYDVLSNDRWSRQTYISSSHPKPVVRRSLIDAFYALYTVQSCEPGSIFDKPKEWAEKWLPVDSDTRESAEWERQDRLKALTEELRKSKKGAYK